MRIHLVTYATRRFRLRQTILGVSARLNHVVDTVTEWNEDALIKAGFLDRCPDIRIDERGSGFWAWKAFIIDAKLRAVPDDDIVFYCDVGRLYPFKLIDQPITSFIRWMDCHKQDVMPGINIPWSSPMARFTKQDAFVLMNMDTLENRSAVPIQVSFSFWKASESSRRVANTWLAACSDRRIISDDPSTCGQESPDFTDHRHDQAIMTLICLREGLKGLGIGESIPQFDERNPSEVSRTRFETIGGTPTLSGRFLRYAVRPLEALEARIRKGIKFNEPIAPASSGSKSS